jgi:hypothetical protein
MHRGFPCGVRLIVGAPHSEHGDEVRVRHRAQRASSSSDGAAASSPHVAQVARSVFTQIEQIGRRVLHSRMPFRMPQTVQRSWGCT